MKRLVGLDIGSYAIKILSLKVGRKNVKVKKFGYGKLSRESIVEGDIMDTNLIEKRIRNVYNEENVKNKNLSISVAGRNIMYKNIKINAVGKDDVKKTLEWELPNHIPYEKDNIYTDYEVLSEEGGQTELLIIAAKKDVVNTRINLLKGLGLMPVVVDTAATSVQNAYETLVGPIEDTAFIVDIGAEKTSMSIVADGVPRFIRELPHGGNAYTNEIAKNLGLNYESAEETKMENNKNNVEIHQYFDSINQNIASEIQKSMRYVKADSPIVVNKGIITGGASLTPGLLDYLRSNLDISNIELFNPVEYLNIPDEYQSEMEELGPSLSVVTGLALRKG
ncbi:MAG: type IV pilus assembly protein PilM [Candidatus Mcinerneyibacterium aminivorans]|uniref:Type IV pilus assembly protein PilM n=1 Tax=Candidatus Mcinerneyibacterium aminivorans TaxID=2703815 RepID=A0A5D0MLF2_9BACT|nr:MAG: type IV pilus assembly protein PilM [Candidatus Mcinerneyibacterium aminivorans]